MLVFALAQGLFWAGIASTFVMGLGTAITVGAIATLAVGAKALAKRIAQKADRSWRVLMRGLEFAPPRWCSPSVFCCSPAIWRASAWGCFNSWRPAALTAA